MAIKITEDLITGLAALARLDLNQAETERFQTDLESILTYLAKIQELDTSKVSPFPDTLDQPAKLRPDVVKKFTDQGLLFTSERLKNGLLNTKGVFNRNDDR